MRGSHFIIKERFGPNRFIEMEKEKETKSKAAEESVPKDYNPRLREAYKAGILPVLLKELGYSSPMAAPRLIKIVINIGVTEAKDNIQVLDQAKEDLSLITGQLPQLRRAKKSISNFKLRQGVPIGLRVTMRGNRMYEFMDRFVSTAVPRIRDFRGLDERAFDGQGNLNVGLKEHHIFPEISSEKSPKPRGMNITFVTTAKTDAEAKRLLELMGVPFRKPEEKQKTGRGARN